MNLFKNNQCNLCTSAEDTETSVCNKRITVLVTVRNTGSVAGKEAGNPIRR
ncbi:MAG: hypothetical protein MJY81_07200 [Bacteroidaceae bacterium]|nr:hypothetical protein [Bacteroidaceae bacterium]